MSPSPKPTERWSVTCERARRANHRSRLDLTDCPNIASSPKVKTVAQLVSQQKRHFDGTRQASGGANTVSANSESLSVRNVCGAPAGMVTRSPAFISDSFPETRAIALPSIT
jgi:hypothetical protein